MDDNKYSCKKCNEEWEFIPEDYDFINSAYPTICPLCSMSVWQMIKDVYEVGGIGEVLKKLWIRYKND